MGPSAGIHVDGCPRAAEKGVHSVHSQTQEASWQRTGRHTLKIKQNALAETSRGKCQAKAKEPRPNLHCSFCLLHFVAQAFRAKPQRTRILCWITPNKNRSSNSPK